MTTDKEKASTMERHGQSIIAAIMLALLVWVGKTVSTQTVDYAVLLSKVSSIEARFDRMEAQLSSSMGDRYKSTDARADFAERDIRIKANSEAIQKFGAEQASRGPRIRQLEEQIKILQGKHTK